MRRLSLNEQSGFVMPTVIILMAIMGIIAYSALLQSNNSLNLAYKQAYIQMARVASKAAVDYAQEQFDNASCGTYSGTAETDLINNNRYRVTYRAEVVSTSTDGYEKTIKGTGSVYLPKLSSTAQYVFDIRSEIVRTYAVCKTPDNFGPLIWLDASNINSLKHIGTSTTTVAPTTAFGNASDSTRNLLEERADNGTQTAASWQSNDFEMHSCDGGEFTNTICNTASTRYLNIGMIYSGVTVPKNATITSASITLACTTPAGTSGSLTHQVYGLYKTATNPHPDAFTSSGSNQLRTPLATASLHTAASTTYSTNNCSPGNNTVVDVTSVAQEVVNNANWNPATGRMGFAFQRTAGSGSRHLLKAGNQLSISYSTSTVAQAANTESIGQWDDLSGNGNNAIFAFGNAPTRQDNQINAKTVVRFNGGAMLSSLVSALSGKREMTVFAVMKTNYGTSNSDGRAITGMSSSGTNDTTSGTSIIPLLRSGTNSGFSSLYSGSATTYRTNFTCGATCASTAYLYDTVFTINDSDSIDATLKGNGVPVATKNNMSPSGSPYTFGLNQFYFGGRRNGAMPGTGADYLNGDYAELVVYDKVLTCRQIEALEEYFRAKWAISASQYSTTCPADLVPVL